MRLRVIRNVAGCASRDGRDAATGAPVTTEGVSADDSCRRPWCGCRRVVCEVAETMNGDCIEGRVRLPRKDTRKPKCLQPQNGKPGKVLTRLWLCCVKKSLTEKILSCIEICPAPNRTVCGVGPELESGMFLTAKSPLSAALSHRCLTTIPTGGEKP